MFTQGEKIVEITKMFHFYLKQKKNHLKYIFFIIKLEEENISHVSQ